MTKIVLSVQTGPLQGKKWVFDEHEIVLVGRHAECLIQLPDDAAHKTVSRHHALLEIAPPEVRLRDFGSLNGTYVNGEKIGARRKGTTPEEAAGQTFPERSLHHGDRIRVGETLFGIDFLAPAPPADQIVPSHVDGSIADARIADARIADARIADFGIVEPKAAELKPVNPGSPSHQPAPHRKSHKPAAHLGDYEIVRELGRGGMGQVFLAKERSTGRSVALKVMLPRAASNESSRLVFLREISLAQELKHPNVVQMFDSGRDKERFFFTLEFCEQGSLREWIIKNDGLSWASAKIIIFQILDGLDYLSNVPLTVQLKDGSKQLANGIVHRDLKPENVLLTETSDGIIAKISDVGLSKAFDTAGMSGLTMTGSSCGTSHYMPRQQVINYRFAHPEVDVWSAAAILYWMLTAKEPREFPPRVDPFKIVLTTSAVPIRARNPNIPAPLAEVIDQALQDTPALHYKSSRMLKSDLEAAFAKCNH